VYPLNFNDEYIINHWSNKCHIQALNGKERVISKNPVIN
jgi:hypothetical protein